MSLIKRLKPIFLAWELTTTFSYSLLAYSVLLYILIVSNRILRSFVNSIGQCYPILRFFDSLIIAETISRVGAYINFIGSFYNLRLQTLHLFSRLFECEHDMFCSRQVSQYTLCCNVIFHPFWLANTIIRIQKRLVQVLNVNSLCQARKR